MCRVEWLPEHTDKVPSVNNKRLETGPKGNSKFCLPETLNNNRDFTIRQRKRRRRRKFPFRKRSLPFSRHLEIFLTVNEFFSTKLKKKENMQVAT